MSLAGSHQLLVAVTPDHELLVELEHFPAGLDTAPLLAGLPGDACPCPHRGYVFSGRFTVRYSDHEETLEAGDVFYLQPGHVPVFLEDTEMLELSPAKELAEVVEHVNARALELDEAGWEQR
jgi:hypothetical protein